MKWQGELTSADGSVVTPGSQCVCDSLAGDTFWTLQHVAVVTVELHAGADSVRTHRRNKRIRRNNMCGGEFTQRALNAPQEHHDSSVLWCFWNCGFHDYHFSSLFCTSLHSNWLCFLIQSIVPLSNAQEGQQRFRLESVGYRVCRA